MSVTIPHKELALLGKIKDSKILRIKAPVYCDKLFRKTIAASCIMASSAAETAKVTLQLHSWDNGIMGLPATHMPKFA